MSTTVFVANRTVGLLTAKWNDDLVVNPEENVGSPLDIPSGETLELGTDWDWGRLPVADIAPELSISDETGVVVYELPDDSEHVPDDPRWTKETCGYPGPCRYTLTIAE